jgi:hypothetical protein
VAENAWLLPAMALLSGAVLVAWGFAQLKRKRLLEDTPTSKVRSMAVGLVELHARAFVSDGKPVQAPFSGADCCWYRYKVEEYRQQGKNSHWVTLLEQAWPDAVWVGDDTGEVLVRTAQAKMDVPKTFELESGWGKDPPERVQRFLDEHHTAWRGWLMNKKMRYTEHALAPGRDVYVMGTAALAAPPAAGAPASARTDIVLEKGRSGGLIVSTKSEQQLDRNLAAGAAVATGLGALLVLAGLVALVRGMLP